MRGQHTAESRVADLLAVNPSKEVKMSQTASLIPLLLSSSHLRISAKLKIGVMQQNNNILFMLWCILTQILILLRNMLYGIHTASSSNLIWKQSAKLRTLTQRKACWSGWRPLVTNCFLIQGVRKYVSKCNVGAWPQRPPSCRPISSVHRELSINADCTGSDTTLRYPALPLVRPGHVITSLGLWLASLATWPYHWALVGQPPDGACKLPQRMQQRIYSSFIPEAASWDPLTCYNWFLRFQI